MAINYIMTTEGDVIKSILESGAYDIDYRKADGKIQTHRVTLHPSLIGYPLHPLGLEEAPPKSENEPITSLLVWDLDREAWRTISIKNIVGVRIDDE